MILALKRRRDNSNFSIVWAEQYLKIFYSFCAESVPIISHLLTSHDVPETKWLHHAYALVH